MVANRRRSGFDSGTLASITTTIISCVRQFLRSCRSLLPPGVEPAERALRHQTPSRATTLPTRTDGATQIGSQHTSQTKPFHGLTSSRVATIFAVHARLIVHATRLKFSCLWVGPRPMRNSSLTGLWKLFRPRLACIRAPGGRVTLSKNYQRKLVEFSPTEL
jgi:hypothetical protein